MVAPLDALVCLPASWQYLQVPWVWYNLYAWFLRFAQLGYFPVLDISHIFSRVWNFLRNEVSLLVYHWLLEQLCFFAPLMAVFAAHSIALFTRKGSSSRFNLKFPLETSYPTTIALVPRSPGIKSFITFQNL